MQSPVYAGDEHRRRQGHRTTPVPSSGAAAVCDAKIPPPPNITQHYGPVYIWLIYGLYMAYILPRGTDLGRRCCSGLCVPCCLSWTAATAAKCTTPDLSTKWKCQNSLCLYKAKDKTKYIDFCMSTDSLFLLKACYKYVQILVFCILSNKTKPTQTFRLLT